MNTQSIRAELSDFVQFASRQIDIGDERLSMEELVRQWRLTAEYEGAVDDVRQGLIDDAQGKAQPLADAFAAVRLKLGLKD